MTLDQLKIFAAVAEREHVTQAAAALDMTQSAVSAAISSLEREFGVRLFHRVGRRIVLSDAGTILLGEAGAILGRAEAAALAMREVSGLARGRLEIKASHTIASQFLPERLVRFHKAHPGLTLSLSIGNSAEVAEAILDGRLELGFVEGPEGDGSHPQLVTELIAHDPLVMVVSAAHPWRSRAALTAEDLAGEHWVLREVGSGTRAASLDRLHALGVPPDALRIAIELPSNQAVLTAVLANAGAAILSESACASALEAGRLHALPIPLTPRAFFAVQHADRYRSRAAAAFLASLREAEA